MLEKLNGKRQGWMTSRSPIMEKTNTPLDETIHIMPKCAMHLHGHRNKMVPLMKPFILADLNNSVKFHSCTYCLTNDTRSHCLPHWVGNHHINNPNPFKSCRNWLVMKLLMLGHTIALSTQHAHFLEWGHTWHLEWRHVWLFAKL